MNTDTCLNLILFPRLFYSYIYIHKLNYHNDLRDSLKLQSVQHSTGNGLLKIIVCMVAWYPISWDREGAYQDYVTP